MFLKAYTLIIITLVSIVYAVNVQVNRHIQRYTTRGKLRIAGGVPASQGDFPFLVAIGAKSDGSVYCCGALLSSRYVLTAAHCLQDDPSNPGYYDAPNILVTAGRINLSNTSIGLQVGVNVKIVNSAFNPNTVINDIALLQLSNDVLESGDDIQYLNLTSTPPTAGEVLWAAGWGLIPGSQTQPTVAYKVQISVSSNITACDGTSPYNFCAGDGAGHDTCEGDSGSSLTYNDPVSGRWVSVGITSYGTSSVCGAAGAVGAYTNVYNYLSWVSANTAGVITSAPTTTNEPSESATIIVSIGLLFTCLIIYLV
jgi:secreted trypsin-like serine protease